MKLFEPRDSSGSGVLKRGFHPQSKRAVIHESYQSGDERMCASYSNSEKEYFLLLRRSFLIATPFTTPFRRLEAQKNIQCTRHIL